MWSRTQQFNSPTYHFYRRPLVTFWAVKVACECGPVGLKVNTQPGFMALVYKKCFQIVCKTTKLHFWLVVPGCCVSSARSQATQIPKVREYHQT